MENNWISVKDRLPEHEVVKLLIPYSPSEPDIGYYCQKYKCFRFNGDDGPHDIQPTHWQPLPEPPKEIQ